HPDWTNRDALQVLSLGPRLVTVGAGRRALAVVLVHRVAAGPLAALVGRLALNLRARARELGERRRGDEGNKCKGGQDRLHCLVSSLVWFHVTAAICSMRTPRATNNALSKTHVFRTLICAALCEVQHTLFADDLCEDTHMICVRMLTLCLQKMAASARKSRPMVLRL